MKGPVFPARLHPLLDSLPKLRPHRDPSRVTLRQVRRFTDNQISSQRRKRHSGKSPAMLRSMEQNGRSCSLPNRICSRICLRACKSWLAPECPVFSSWSYQEVEASHDQ